MSDGKSRPLRQWGGICARDFEANFSVFEFAVEHHVFDLVLHVEFY